MNQLLLGGIAMGSMIIGLFFLRFWKNTGDRFFLFFAASFGLEGVNRVLLGLYQGSDEHEPIFYWMRLLSFLLILIAIIDKNRANRITSSLPDDPSKR
jgi:hypothetical protein